MSRSTTRLLPLLVLLASAAFAQKRAPQEFIEPTPMTEEQIAAAKAASRSNLHGYGKDAPVEVEPLPWGFLGFVGIVALIALPFGIRAYQDTKTVLTPDEEARPRPRRRPPSGRAPSARPPSARPPPTR